MKRIAVVSSLYKPTRADAIGGQEVWTALFTEELGKRGYMIDLYGLPGSLSLPNISLIPIPHSSLDEVKSHTPQQVPEIRKKYYEEVLHKLHEQKYDLIFDSTGDSTISSRSDVKIPIVIIGHLPVNKPYLEQFHHVSQPENVYVSLPSRYQKQQAPWLKRTVFIPHGIPVNNFTFLETSQGTVYWVGRVPDDDPKGLQGAITVVTCAHRPLTAYATFDHETFYTEHFKSQLSGKITILPSEGNFYKNITPSQHTLLLYPIVWEEPFGLVLLESMACGTPVIAFAKGATPEIIKDGETGFMVNPSDDDIRGDWIIKKTGLTGLQEAVETLYNLPTQAYQTMRKNCREQVEKNFSIEKMVDKYEELYKTICNL